MSRQRNLDKILAAWPFNPNSVDVRPSRGDDGRPLLLMRVDMGVLQLETRGRPDGEQPFGYPTILDYLRNEEDEGFVLDSEQCLEADREFVQFYHRRVCWLSLREFDRAIQDADHTLALMDFCRDHSPSEEWTFAHEQYRPFVLFHRTQAATLSMLESGQPEMAVKELDQAVERLAQVYAELDAEDLFEDDELVVRLTELRDSLRQQYDVGSTLQEQLEEAVAREEYELAAKLRDEIARRRV